MKKTLFILATVLFQLNSFAQLQYTSIPDPFFEQALIDQGIDSGTTDGWVLKANINSITSLDVSALTINMQIFDLTGIQDFISLTTLNCSGHSFSSLDLRGLSALVTLDCSGNFLMTSIDLSGLSSLMTLNCTSNSSLNSLDVTNLTALTTLNCSGNALTILDVNSLTLLTTLNCSGNGLTSLSISGLLNLTTLYCQNNLLTSLFLTGLPALTDLYCMSNAFTSLNISGLPALTTLWCSNNNQLTSLNLSILPALTTLECRQNKLTSLNVSGLPSLTTLECGQNQLTSLSVSGLTALTLINCENNQLTNVNLSGLTSLTSLNFRFNQFTSLSVSGLPALQYFACSENQLTSLIVSGLPSLINMSCFDNQLTSLVLSNLPAFTTLSCQNNPPLTCIQVDDIAAANSYTFSKDANAFFSLTCNPTTTCDKWSLCGNAATATDFIGTTNSNPLIFVVNNVKSMSLDNGGNVSISTGGVSTYQKLYVETSKQNDGIQVNQTGDSAATLDLNASGGSGKRWALHSTGSGNYQGAGHLLFWDWTSNEERMRINNDGKVRIGNFANMPNGYKLFVEEGILTEKIKVAVVNSGAWADYVFANNYKLKPLSEVEAFIKENNHLPNVPSATELVKEGLDIGKMQAAQMEKIEELTLYMIEMKKEIDTLKKENQLLKTLVSNVKN